MQILIVDDTQSELLVLKAILDNMGLKIVAVDSGSKALSCLLFQDFVAVLLDVDMPLMDGFDLVERLRKNGNNVPVLMLSARADRVDITRGLTLGADDYVVKPFGLEELVLRLKAILRRSHLSGAPSTSLKCGPISINDATHTVTFNEEVIDLSPTEYRLLQVLIENKNRVLSKSVLLDDVWGITFESESTVVDTYISYLRKKLHRDDFDGIKTIRGVGFVIQEPKKQ